MPSSNASLAHAKRAKNDEFYTQASDIEEELRHYWPHFYGKTVLCNCDDPYESNFFYYFAQQFDNLHLRKLISTCYAGSPIARLQHEKVPYRAVMDHMTRSSDGFGHRELEMMFDNGEIEVKRLEGDGSFDSPECLRLLDECDIVVTNPAFSSFRRFVSTLMEHEKKFIIWGNNNAITYKEFFPLLKDNKVWVGYLANKTCYFQIPDSYEKWDERFTAQMNDGHKYGKVPAITVYTNLDIKKRHEPLDLWRRYYDDPSLYPKYDNYDAIEVPRVSLIPCDYEGEMGLPITVMDKYDPDQLQIIGSFNNSRLSEKATENYVLSVDTPTLINGQLKPWNGPVINQKPLYKRVVVRLRNPKPRN